MPKKVTIYAKDIVPMATGGGASVSFNIDKNPEIGTYFMETLEEKPDLMELRYGDIHSHNSMPVWFSSTDDRDIAKSIGNYYIFLSMVINNWQEYIIRVIYPVKVKKVSSFSKIFKRLSDSLSFNVSGEEEEELELWYYESKGSFKENVPELEEFAQLYNKVVAMEKASKAKERKSVPHQGSFSTKEVPRVVNRHHGEQLTFDQFGVDHDIDKEEVIDILPTPLQCYAIDEEFGGSFQTATDKLKAIYPSPLHADLLVSWDAYLSDYFEGDDDFNQTYTELQMMREEVNSNYFDQFLKIFEQCMKDLRDHIGIL